ncbi:hypothetical protein EHS25_000164 [Saitozyma podzolica]|uniref:Uncharacterized protein n=1 Tax=Saitozyma podzolica TaxID=1890683 RepID=A0A427YVB3_9TREE|nr:hypothetical protein EHS25_000164 [Saitozyma podzolica]
MSDNSVPAATDALPRHYLVITYPSWAHNRSELALALTLLHLNPSLLVTVLIHSNRSKASALEIAQYPHISQPERMRVIHYGNEGQVEGEGMFNPRGGFRAQITQETEGWAEKLAKLESVVDTVTGEHVQPHQVPLTAILSDITLALFAHAIKGAVALSEPDRTPPKAFAFCPYNAAFIVQLFVEELSDYVPRVRRAFILSNEDILHIPGTSPAHYYELAPIAKESMTKSLSLRPDMPQMTSVFFDGAIIGWPAVLSADLEPVIAKTLGASFAVGPALPRRGAEEWSVELHQGACNAYLDEVLRTDGPQSLLYISFGSVVFAPSEQQLSILFDILEELHLPFILAQGNAQDGNCPPEVREMMLQRVGKGKNRGLLLPWAPQRAILDHPATGLFLSHGGSNSALEAIMSRVPMIMWPSGFDQPSIANELDTLGVARELFQIRDGPNIGRPVTRNDIGVQGTPEAIREEMLDVFGGLRGLRSDSINALRARVDEVRERVREDREVGMSHHNLMRLAFLERA